MSARWLAGVCGSLLAATTSLSTLPATLATSTAQGKPDFYALLALPRTASQAQIKTAYHQALLRHHPDKRLRTSNSRNSPGAHAASASDTLAIDVDEVSVTLIKDAYLTLSCPAARVQYDSAVSRASLAEPRPAQVISLDDMDEVQTDAGVAWEHGCRCGGTYRIADAEMSQGVHLVGCTSCSEVIWVGYEDAGSEDEHV